MLKPFVQRPPSPHRALWQGMLPWRRLLLTGSTAVMVTALAVPQLRAADVYNADFHVDTARSGQAGVENIFNEGMRELESGDLQVAISSFERILAQQPEKDRVRMELALAYMRSYDYARAETLAREVLGKPETPAGVKVRIQEFLSVVEARKEPHKFTPYVSLGMKYDDNVNAGPQLDEFYGLTLQEDSKPQEDMAITAMAGVNHTFQTGKTVNIADRTAAFFWQSTASAYRNDYLSENDYDLTIASVSTGPTLVAARKWRANVNARLDHIYLDTDHLADYVSVNPNVTVDMAKGKAKLTVDGKWQYRDFKRSTDAERDSEYVSAGMRLRYHPDTKSRVEASAHLFNEKADIERHSKDGYRLGVGGQTELTNISQRTSLYGHYTYKKTQHNDVEPIANIARDEDYRKATVGVRHTFSKNTSRLDGWTMNASYSHITNDSNVTLYGYDRNQIGVSMRRSF